MQKKYTLNSHGTGYLILNIEHYNKWVGRNMLISVNKWCFQPLGVLHPYNFSGLTIDRCKIKYKRVRVPASPLNNETSS